MIVVNLLINVDNPKEDGTFVIVMAGEHGPMTAEERRLKLKGLLENGSKIPQPILDCVLKYHHIFSLEMEKGSMKGWSTVSTLETVVRL
uniref:Uncharacterized protein n=1 Tax=Amphimedon queenslandica TaxID=400682 RepID=A0A1X7UZS7_AMPQE